MRTGRTGTNSLLPSRDARCIAFLAVLWLAGCYSVGNKRIAQTAKSQVNESTAHGSGHVTVASWYGPGFIGRRTASGQVYRPDDLTAASRSLPLGTRVQVTNLDNGKSVVVRVDDRGPYVRGRGIDLSQRAAENIGLNHSGIARVVVTRLDGTASAASPEAAPFQWRGEARITHRYPKHRIRYADLRRHPRYGSSHVRYRERIVANPVGEWLLQMVR